MKTLSRFFAIALLASATTGCIYVDGERIDTNDWKQTQHHNRERISQLELGLSTDAVISDLGAPAESEAFMDGDSEIRVFFYRTTRKHADGETSRDETTPLVFRNNKLIGWGQSVYENAR